MAGYYDSSILLAVILGQFAPADLAAAWDGERVRVASLTVRIECTVAIRRIAAGMAKRQAARWSASRMEAIEAYLQTLTIKPVDSAIDDIIRQEPRLVACRALDAIHLATALHLQSHLQEPLYICSLDRRLREVAVRLGFEVRPAFMPNPVVEKP